MLLSSTQVILHSLLQLTIGLLLVTSRLIILISCKALVELSLQLLERIVRAIAGNLALLIAAVP